MSIYSEYSHEFLPLSLTNSTSLLFFILRYRMCLSLCPSSQQQLPHNAPLCNKAAPIRDTIKKTPEQHNISTISLITIVIIYPCYYDKIPVNLRFPLLHSGDICLDLPPYIIPPWSIKWLPLNRKHSNSMQDLRLSQQSCWTCSSWSPERQQRYCKARLSHKQHAQKVHCGSAYIVQQCQFIARCQTDTESAGPLGWQGGGELTKKNKILRKGRKGTDTLQWSAMPQRKQVFIYINL